jgi:hypothetical protein
MWKNVSPINKKLWVLDTGYIKLRIPATILQNLAEQLFAELGSDEYYDIALELEQAVVDILRRKRYLC